MQESQVRTKLKNVQKLILMNGDNFLKTFHSIKEKNDRT